METTRLDIKMASLHFVRHTNHDMLVVRKIRMFVESESNDDHLGEEFRGRWCRGSNASSSCGRSGCG